MALKAIAKELIAHPETLTESGYKKIMLTCMNGLIDELSEQSLYLQEAATGLKRLELFKVILLLIAIGLIIFK